MNIINRITIKRHTLGWMTPSGKVLTNHEVRLLTAMGYKFEVYA